MKVATDSKNSIARFLSRQKGVAKFLLLGTFLATGIQITRLANQSQGIQNLQQGVQTCFQRVYQTYTAKLIGATQSNYLQNQFMQTTEKCFGETLNQVQAMGLGVLGSAGETLNSLSSDTHRFHQRLTSDEGTETMDSGVQVSQVGDRFSKLENLKSEALGQLGSANGQLQSQQNTFQWIFFSAAGLFVVFLFSEIVWGMRRRAKNYQLESQAKKVSEGYKSGPSEAIENLVEKALAEHQLPQCAKLFSQYRQGLFRGEQKPSEAFPTGAVGASAMVGRDQVGEQRPVEFGKTAPQREAHIEQIWSEWTERDHVVEGNEKANGKPQKDSQEQSETRQGGVHLDALLAELVHRFSDQIFSSRIALNLDVDEEIYIQGDGEQIQEALYHLISGSIQRVQKEDSTEQKQITFRLKHNGPSIVLEVNDSGAPLNQQNVDHRITQQMMEDLDCHFKFSYDSAMQTNHLKAFFKEVRPTAQGESSRLIDVKKGSKREILQELENGSSTSKIRRRPQADA